MDNLAAHKVSGIREPIEAQGAPLLHLPAYSPDLNPIELRCAKLKRLLRRASARTIDGPCTTLGLCLDQFTPHECQRYLLQCRYGHPK
jgi:transposase